MSTPPPSEQLLLAAAHVPRAKPLRELVPLRDVDATWIGFSANDNEVPK